MTGRFAGMGSHESAAAGTIEWLTPPSIIAALGPFDLDPCAPIAQPYPTARRVFTVRDNGLLQQWPSSERVWLNPPYSASVIGRWLARLAEHGRGTALIFARTETDAFHRFIWGEASAVLFLRGRLNFHLPDGSVAPMNAGAPSVLCAYGADDADVLAGCEIDGQFVPLRIPRSVVVAALASVGTWQAELAKFFEGRDGPVELADIYRHFIAHPKASNNRNAEAKVRQQLQRGPYRRVERGLWESAP